MNSPLQLSLGISLRDDATFTNFYVKDDNVMAVNAVKALAEGRETHNHLIWGVAGVGLSHLMQAACHEAYLKKRTIQYLPLKEMSSFSAEDICEGLENVNLVCLDGLDAICGNKAWEHAFFHLYNRMRDTGNTLFYSCHSPPPTLPIVLPDLKSRVLGSVIYHLDSMSDDDKVKAMTMRAQARGFELSDEVVKYILHRASRDTTKLFDMLNRLDTASLQRQRKLTIPFVKETLKI